jgi:GAF domain-containing protein/HAMP domain-containing protein
MNEVKNTGAPRRQSIRNRLLALALVVIVVAIVVITVITIDTADSVGRRAQEVSTQSLRSQAEAYLVQINKTIADQSNLILDRAARDIQTVADSTAAIYNGNLPKDYWPVDQHLFPGPEGQFLNSGDDISSVFVPNTRVEHGTLGEEVVRDIELSAYLDLVLPSVEENNPNAAAIYLGTSHDVTRYFPNIKLGEVVPADFQVTQRPWYSSGLEGNKGRETPIPIWSPIYLDATGLGMVTTVAIPIYDQAGNLIGVAGLDITLNEISSNIETTRFLKSGYSFLIDQGGSTIILPDQGYKDILGRPAQPDEVNINLKSEEVSHTSPEFMEIVDQMTSGQSGFRSIQLGGRELFIAYSSLASTGWSLGSVVPAEEVLQSITVLQQNIQQTTRSLLLTRMLPIIAAITIILLILGLIWTNRLVNPIQELAEAAQKIGSGQWDVQVPVKSDDEIGLLATTLNSMTSQLRRSFSELEQRVAERTELLEHRSLQLETAAEVARDIILAQDLESMLQRAVNLISNRFGYYNVGIFLVDELHEYTQLKAASGELGERLPNEQIKLRIGQQGLVGYVTQFGQPRLAEDVTADKIYISSPLLPDTRSEVALPLRIGERVIGALDVQSTQRAAFSQDDMMVLQTLADQLAVAIENIRLVSRQQATLQEVSLLYQEQLSESWSRIATQSDSIAYEYDRMDVKPVLISDLEGGDGDKGAESCNRLLVPVKLREQTIGYIGLESDNPNHKWTEDELAIVDATANQVALTIENARLLAETRRRAARDQLASEVTSRMRESLDMNRILQTTIQEISKKLGIAQVEVRLESNKIAEATPTKGRRDDE